MQVRATILGIVMTGLALPLGAGDRMTIRVSPEISFAPAHLVVRATVEQARENRAIEIVAESDDFYRSSMIELEGDRAPRIETIEFRSLPGGQYEVSVRLIGQGGETLAQVRRQVQVIGAPDRAEP